MGGRHSHNHLDLTDSDSDQDPINHHDDDDYVDDEEEEEEEESLTEKTDVNLHCLRSHLDSLSIRGRKGSDQGSGNEKSKLYRYVFMGAGRISTDQKSPWILVAKDVSWDFRREKDKEEEEEDGEEVKGNGKGREMGKSCGKPNIKEEEDKEDYNDNHVSEAKAKLQANIQAKPKVKPKQMLKEEEEELDYGSGDEEVFSKPWFFIVGSKVKSRVSEKLQLKFYSDKVRVDFVSYGHVWSLKFGSPNEYKRFEIEFHDRLFENKFTLEATEANKMKVFGKDFVGWAKPEEADESIWEDAEENFNCKPSFKGETSFDKIFDNSSFGGQLFDKSLNDKSIFDKRFEKNSPNIVSKTFQEAFIEPCKGATIQSLTMGALDHSFLVSANGIEAMKNLPSGIHGKGISIAFDNAYTTTSTTTPKKAMLMKRESNLMVLSPSKELSGSSFTPHHQSSSGLHQVDIESGKVVAKWKFEKDGTPIQMRDVTNETKSSQLDPTRSTFLGLDDNRLCRWDMRDPHGIVEDLNSPILNWAEGHQFSKGTNFQCFATTGDGAIVVGSKDGKIRLYGTTSMRMAKTAFPGLGSPITHVDVTYDGKWILATTDSYMILISSVFRDKDGKIKTGFSGRMGNNMAAPRLLKLSPLDAHLAGKGYKFHGGQFSWVTESGRQERNLVASVGKFTVIWNFRRVKESNHECYRVTQGLKSCYCYRIIPKEESIVDSKFMHDNTSSVSPLLVATPKKVSCFNV